MQGPASPGACRGISGRSLTTAGPPSLGTRTRLPLPASPLAHLGLAELTAGISPPQEPSSILLKMDVTRELKTPHCGLSQLLGFPDTSPQPFRQTLKDWAEKQLKPQCSLVSPPLSLSLGTLLSCPLEGRNSEKEPAPPVPKRKLTLLPAENKSDNGGEPPLSPEAVSGCGPRLEETRVPPPRPIPAAMPSPAECRFCSWHRRAIQKP